LGGLANALDAGRSTPEALIHAITAGTANALSTGGGQFTLQDFADLRKQVQIENW
jgi:fructose-1-phosphate kinase PfkB-like protein